MSVGDCGTAPCLERCRLPWRGRRSSLGNARFLCVGWDAAFFDLSDNVSNDVLVDTQEISSRSKPLSTWSRRDCRSSPVTGSAPVGAELAAAAAVETAAKTCGVWRTRWIRPGRNPAFMPRKVVRSLSAHDVDGG